MSYNQGGLKSLEAISGVQTSGSSAMEKIFLQNYDSNPAKTNQIFNQTQFLNLTARGNTRAEFNWQNLNRLPDLALGAKVLPETANRQLGIG